MEQMQQPIMSESEMYSHLRSPIGIKESSLYAIISNINISYNQAQQVTHNLHNFCRQRGEAEAFKKVLDILRVNPLLAIKIVKSCSLCKHSEEIYRMIKDMVGAISPWNGEIILNDEVSFIISLIEALYVNGSDTDIKVAGNIFKYIQDVDRLLYQHGKKNKFLTPYNIRHIFRNIPSYRQIELILLFWDQHMYTTSKYGKIDSYSTHCIDTMLKELKNRSFWTHFENKDMALSEREKDELEREIAMVKNFIDQLVVHDEGRHLHYIKAILGPDQLAEKVKAIMGSLPSSHSDFEKAVENCEREVQRRKEERTAAYLKRTGKTPKNHKKPYKKPHKKSPQ